MSSSSLEWAPSSAARSRGPCPADQHGRPHPAQCARGGEPGQHAGLFSRHPDVEVQRRDGMIAADGSYTIPDVPDGDYNMVIPRIPLDYTKPAPTPEEAKPLYEGKIRIEAGGT